MNTYWYKQTKDKPLFPDFIWSRPDNKRLAGKLLVIGGNTHEFSAPGEAYDQAVKSGIGVVRVLIPDTLKKIIGEIFVDCEYATSNKSGGFSRQSLDTWLEVAGWADGVLIAGDLGRNSETSIVLESFISKYSGQLTVTKDAVDYFSNQSDKILIRSNTTIVLSLAQLQKICIGARWQSPIVFSMTLHQLVEELHEITKKYPCNIITEHNGVIFVAVQGKVSTTSIGSNSETWRVKTAAVSSVWWVQNPSKPFEALSTALVS